MVVRNRPSFPHVGLHSHPVAAALRSIQAQKGKPLIRAGVCESRSANTDSLGPRGEAGRLTMLGSLFLTILATLAVNSSAAWSQEAPRGHSEASELGTRDIALTAGLGNMYGWVGVGAEYYMLSSRVSGVVGFGFVLETYGNPSTVGFAGAVRGFTSGEKHRAFLELSVSLVAVEGTKIGDDWVDVKRYYGPGLSVGYHYTATGGFTFLVSAGAGWAVGLDEVGEILLLGLGYTWRRWKR